MSWMTPGKHFALRAIINSMLGCVVLACGFLYSRSQWEAVLSLEWTRFVLFWTRIIMMCCLSGLIVSCVGFYLHKSRGFQTFVKYVVLCGFYWAVMFSVYVTSFHSYFNFVSPRVEITVPKGFVGEFSIFFANRLSRTGGDLLKTEGRTFRYDLPADGLLEVGEGYITLHKRLLSVRFDDEIPVQPWLGSLSGDDANHYFDCYDLRRINEKQAVLNCIIFSPRDLEKRRQLLQQRFEKRELGI